MSAKHFIGFGLLEDWRWAIDPARPVQADCIVDSNGHAKNVSLTYWKQVIVVSQSKDGDVAYCRIVVDTYKSMNGVTPAFEADKHRRHAETAWAVIQTWLAEQGLRWQRAVVATPRNLKMLEGYADCLRYDKTSDSWLRADPQGVIS